MGAPGMPVILLHGLGRGPRSMARLAARLGRDGHPVANLGYPSRRLGIAACADGLLGPFDAFAARHGSPVAIVGHSMGGLVARRIAAAREGLVGGIVTIGSPHRGSEAADAVSRTRLGQLAFGPAIGDLRTDAWHAHPAPRCPVHAIAGDRARVPLFSWAIPGPHDGLVSLERSRIGAGEEWTRVAGGHTFLMDHPGTLDAIRGSLASWRA